MDPNKNHITPLEALPQNLLGIIVSKIASTYTKSYANCILSCKELGASATDERVCKTLNLAPLVKKPLETIKYFPVTKRCLESNNLDAHYIKCILRYFLLNHSIVGLHHLRVAADTGKKDVIYLYGILLMLNQRYEDGKNYLGQLKWSEDTTAVDTSWKNIKASLHGIRLVRKRCYLVSLQKMKPPNNLCHLNDMDNNCEKCFYYKQMFKFIFMI